MFFPLWHCNLRESLRLRRNLRLFPVHGCALNRASIWEDGAGVPLTALAVIAVFVGVDEIVE